MAWVDVPGSNEVWQYENTATAANTYSDSAAGANSVIANGIRTYTAPGTGKITALSIIASLRDLTASLKTGT